MLLKTLIKDCGEVEIKGRTDLDIKSICSDSRKAAENSLFIAVPGYSCDGHKYIGSALKSGAKAIIYENEGQLEEQLAALDQGTKQDAVFIKVTNSRNGCGGLRILFYGSQLHRFGAKQGQRPEIPTWNLLQPDSRPFRLPQDFSGISKMQEIIFRYASGRLVCSHKH